MATNGKISEQSKQVQAVFDFINSDAGQKIIEKVGLVTPNKSKIKREVLWKKSYQLLAIRKQNP